MRKSRPAGSILTVTYVGCKPYLLEVGEAARQFAGIPLESETPGTPVLSAEIGKPLWVVDGIEVAPDFINKLDPNRIENITVLKDQSAVATYGQEARNGVVIITTKGDTALPARPENARQEHGNATTQAEAHDEAIRETGETEDDQPFLIAETMPLFPMQEGGNPGYGDLNTFRAWVQKNIKYPAEAFRNGEQGRIVLSFVVEKDGSVSNIQILQTPGKAFSEETRRVVAASPKWKPGEQRGEKVRVRYTLPVDFRITATAQDTKTSENKGSGEEPFLVVDTPPQFNGGDIGEFRRWVQMNVKYPAEAPAKTFTGKSWSRSSSRRTARWATPKYSNRPINPFADEVLRVIGKSPKWTPGKQRGEAVRVKFGMPVDFAVQTSEGILHDKDTAQREGDMEEILVVGYGTQKVGFPKHRTNHKQQTASTPSSVDAVCI